MLSKLAHDGLLTIANCSFCWSPSLALGWNWYGWPSVAVVAGAPEIVGATPRTTLMPNLASPLRLTPSLTEIWMPLILPTSIDDGVPYRRPVLASKLAQRGFLLIAKVSCAESGSLALGRKS